HLREDRLQVGQLAGLLHHVDPPVIDRDARRVVAAVLHASQRLQRDAQSLSFTDVSHDSTHGGNRRGIPLSHNRYTMLLDAPPTPSHASQLPLFRGVTFLTSPIRYPGDVSANLKKHLAQLSKRGPHRVLVGDLAYAGLPGKVYAPAEGNSVPAIAFGHDWMKSVRTYHATLRHLASGCIV